MLDDDPFAVLREVHELAPPQNLHIRIAGEQPLHLGFEIGLIEEIADRPAEWAIGAPKLRQHRSVLENPLHRGVEQHVGFQIRCHARGLEDAHAFVVGVDGAGVAVEFRLALEREHAQASAAEQMGERQPGRSEPDNGDVEYVLRIVHGAFPLQAVIVQKGEYSLRNSDVTPLRICASLSPSV